MKTTPEYRQKLRDNLPLFTEPYGTIVSALLDDLDAQESRYEKIRARKAGEPEMRVIPSRTTDPETSHAAESDVEFRANTHKHFLLRTYVGYDRTDDEAALAANLLDTCFWKRCSELREVGMIADTGLTRTGLQGSARMVCALTEAGRLYLLRLRGSDETSLPA